MNDKLKKFINDAFKPYGDFPARNEVEQELLANLTEKYNDLVNDGKTEKEAYELTVESFGDVSEIMEHISHTKNTKGAFKDDDNRFRSSALADADLAGTSLVNSNFGMSDLRRVNFDNTDMRDTRFKGSDLTSASFVGANATNAIFGGSDLSGSNFTGANLTDARFTGCAFKNAKFGEATLDNTTFRMCDLGKLSFDGLTLRGTVFDKTSIRNTSFKNVELINVSFHHSDAKKAIFDGATMDKITYALLKSAKANLDNVKIN